VPPLQSLAPFPTQDLPDPIGWVLVVTPLGDSVCVVLCLSVACWNPSSEAGSLDLPLFLPPPRLRYVVTHIHTFTYPFVSIYTHFATHIPTVVPTHTFTGSTFTFVMVLFPTHLLVEPLFLIPFQVAWLFTLCYPTFVCYTLNISPLPLFYCPMDVGTFTFVTDLCLGPWPLLPIARPYLVGFLPSLQTDIVCTPWWFSLAFPHITTH